MKKALVLSILVHAGVLAGARPLTASLAPDTRPEPAALSPDRWTGTSIEVSTGDDAPLGTPDPAAGTRPGAVAASQNTSPAADAAGAPATGPAGAPAAPATATAKPVATTTATAAASAHPSAQPSSRPPRAARPRRPKRGPRAAALASSAAPLASSAAPSASSASPGDTPASPTASSAAAVGAGAGSSGTFGSDGPASVRDLGRAFTRAIPAACAADPAWSKLAAGDAGTLRVEIRVDSEGHIQSAQPVGDDPPKHLVNVIRRTVPLLQAGTFAVRGGTPTAGIQTLELKATVGEDAAGDDDSGARDRLAFSYEGGRGKASFTQTGGRRVDIQVRVVSVKVGE